SNAYAVVVTATDATGSKTTQTITVNVTNAAVSFSSPNTKSVPENSTAVLTVTASSADGTPTYQVTGGADGALFNIDPNSGPLSSKTAPTFEDPGHTPTYVVQVPADDGHGGTADQTITVTVTNVNEPPTATADSYATDNATTKTGNVITDDTGNG